MTATRRRGAALEDAILDAGWDQLLEHGYEGFTFEAVAERARTGKAVLYRRWPDKPALLMAVLAHHDSATRERVPDTGSLRGDVLSLLRAANRRGASAAAIFSTILGVHFYESAATPADLRAQVIGAGSVAMEQVLARAVERGEIAAVPSPRIVTLPGDLLRHELFMTLGPVPDTTIVGIVDDVFLPLVTGRTRKR
jgi:AcrR family transcriptional regulator